MKSILSNNNCEKKEKPFPKLMIYSVENRIVLFSREGTGVCVYQGTGDYLVGVHSDNWSLSAYKDYEGSVCLSNE